MADRDSRAGARYATPEILTYVDRLHAAHDTALQRAFAAPDAHAMPAIQVGASEGRFLQLLVQLMGAKKIVEVGTLAGYSALRMAKAMPDDGHLWTLELDPKHAHIARQNIAAAGLAERVTVMLGDAHASLRELQRSGPFDLVFLDADKGAYVDYGRWAAQHLRAGGVLIADNVYFFGKLLDAHDPDAARVRAFHEETARCMQSVCIPTPDGLLLGIKP